MMANSFVGKLLSIAEKSQNMTTSDQFDIETLRSKIAFSFKHRFNSTEQQSNSTHSYNGTHERRQNSTNNTHHGQHDEVENMKMRIAQNLNERFNEKKHKKDNEEEGEKKHQKKNQTEGHHNKTQKNETHQSGNNEHANRTHNETKKAHNETKPSHNETKKAHNETKKSHNETSTKSHNKTEGKTEKKHQYGQNETRPESNDTFKVGETDEDIYYDQYANSTNQTDAPRPVPYNSTLFLQGTETTEDGANLDNSADYGLPWYVTTLITVGGFLFIAFLAILTKKFCHSAGEQDQNFHHINDGAKLVCCCRKRHLED